MRILIVTDAWAPHAHAAVVALIELVRQLQADGHAVEVIHPGLFRHLAGPGWLGMDLAVLPARALRQRMCRAAPDAIHLATEGPLGWAARRICRAQGWGFTSSWSSGLATRLQAGLRLPAGWTQALQRRFHRPAQRVLASNQALADGLRVAGLPRARAWFAGVDTRLFAPAARAGSAGPLGPLAHPVSLYVGQVTLDQGIEDFLKMDLPGSKLVCGAGPDLSALRQRYPNVHWFGHLPRGTLARVYAAADVLVHPGGQALPPAVVLEALACGTPVAARPTEGLLQLIGQSRAAALQSELREAWHEALRIPRHEARAGALRFAWPRAAERFVAELHALHALPAARPHGAAALHPLQPAADRRHSIMRA
jgi:glycosyltransferase involved in cell wall biosynthesis